MYFVGEQGEDYGGLRRELFSLLADRIKDSLLEGRTNQFVFRHDMVALQVRLSL